MDRRGYRTRVAATAGGVRAEHLEEARDPLDLLERHHQGPVGEVPGGLDVEEVAPRLALHGVAQDVGQVDAALGEDA